MIRAPAGRAGRLWLVRRLEIARRGADVLDQKRRTLVRERERTARALANAQDAWEHASGEATRSNDRALALVGSRRLRLAAAHHDGPANAVVSWRNALGTVIPDDVRVDFGKRPNFVSLGGGSSVALAADAHRRAVAAAAAYAAARFAHEAIVTELAFTTRRLRAIERRWIPDHERALRRLDLELAELELEDITRVHYAVERESTPSAPSTEARLRDDRADPT
jgi:V/A-type H+/Na+-transporting ATPase subunit D